MSKNSSAGSSADRFPGDHPEVEAFHRSRRMFAILDKKLHLAEPAIPDSHTEWFLRTGMISSIGDEVFDRIVRGFVDSAGVYFYRGVDFDCDESDEENLRSVLKQLVETLSLAAETPVFGGMIRQNIPGRWPPKRVLGNIAELLLLNSR